MKELGHDVTSGPFAVQLRRQTMQSNPFPAEDIITVQNLLTCMSPALFRGPTRKLLSFDVLVGNPYVLPCNLSKYSHDLLTKIDTEIGQKASVKLKAIKDRDGDIQKPVFCDGFVAEEVVIPDSPDKIVKDANYLFESQDGLEDMIPSSTRRCETQEDELQLIEKSSDIQMTGQRLEKENCCVAKKSESASQQEISVEVSLLPAADQFTSSLPESSQSSSALKVSTTPSAFPEAPPVRKIRRPRQTEAQKSVQASRQMPASSSVISLPHASGLTPSVQVSGPLSKDKEASSQVTEKSSTAVLLVKSSAKDEWEAAAVGRPLPKTSAETITEPNAALDSSTISSHSSVQDTLPMAAQHSQNATMGAREACAATSCGVGMPVIHIPQTATQPLTAQDSHPPQSSKTLSADGNRSGSLPDEKEVFMRADSELDNKHETQAQSVTENSPDGDILIPGLTLLSKSNQDAIAACHNITPKDTADEKSDLPELVSPSVGEDVSESSKNEDVKETQLDSFSTEKSLKRPFPQRGNIPEETKKIKEDKVPNFGSHSTHMPMEDSVSALGQRRSVHEEQRSANEERRTSLEERSPLKDQIHRPWLNRLDNRTFQQVPGRDPESSFGRAVETEHGPGHFRGPEDSHIPSLLNIRVGGGSGNQRSLPYDRDAERNQTKLERSFHSSKTFDHQRKVADEDFGRRSNPNLDHRVPGFLHDFEGPRRNPREHLGQLPHRDARNLNFLGVDISGGIRQEMGQVSERWRDGGALRLDRSEFLSRDMEPGRGNWIGAPGPQWQSMRQILRPQQSADFGGLRSGWAGSQQLPDNFLGVRRPFDMLSQRNFPEGRERLGQRGNEADFRSDTIRNSAFRGFPPGRRPSEF